MLPMLSISLTYLEKKLQKRKKKKLTSKQK